MADNTTLNLGTGGDTIATDDIGGGVKIQRVKVAFGVDGSAADVSAASPLPVTGGTLPATTTFRLVSAAATTNATSVKGSAGTLRRLTGYNASTFARYLKLYDKATAPTVGTDTPRKTLYLPPATAFALDYNDSFTVGIALALTGAAADADTTALTAGDVVCLNVDYL